MTESSESNEFFVKLYKQAGEIVGHALSVTGDFSKLEKSLTPQPETQKNSLDIKLKEHQDSFVHSMTVYNDFMPAVFSLVPVVSGKMFIASMQSFLKEKASSEIAVRDGEIYRLDIRLYSDFMRINENIRPSFDVLTSMTRNILMGMIALLDHHIRGLMRISLYARPEWLENAQSKFTLQEIFSFESLDSFRERAIETEIDRMSREPREKQLEWFEEKFKLEKISECFEGWPQLMEICERRNLFAHTNGHVSKQYMDQSKVYKYSLNNIQIGQKLGVTAKYYKQSVTCIFEFGVMLTYRLSKRLLKNARSGADNDINELCLNLLQRGEYSLALRLLKAVCLRNDLENDRIKRVLMVNCANAMKLNNHREDALELLAKDDWTACGPEFEVCLAAIRGDVDDVVRAMKMAKELGIAEDAYREWPVFFEVREDPKFAKAYEELFGLPYSPAPRKRDPLSELASHLRADLKFDLALNSGAELNSVPNEK